MPVFGQQYKKVSIQILLTLVFITSFLTNTHIHSPYEKKGIDHHCEVCVITHNFIAPDLAQTDEYTSSLLPFLYTITYPVTLYKNYYQKYIYTQAPPVL